MTAALTKEAPRHQAPAFQMPLVEVGDMVYWYDHGDLNQAPHPAIVAAVYESTICINLISPNIYNTQPVEGVRHIDDPKAKRPEFIENGGWDYTPTLRMLRTLDARLDAIDAKIADLTKKLPGSSK